jgi:hypothetical protein
MDLQIRYATLQSSLGLSLTLDISCYGFLYYETLVSITL